MSEQQVKTKAGEPIARVTHQGNGMVAVCLGLGAHQWTWLTAAEAEALAAMLTRKEDRE